MPRAENNREGRQRRNRERGGGWGIRQWSGEGLEGTWKVATAIFSAQLNIISLLLVLSSFLRRYDIRHTTSENNHGRKRKTVLKFRKLAVSPNVRFIRSETMSWERERILKLSEKNDTPCDTIPRLPSLHTVIGLYNGKLRILVPGILKHFTVAHFRESEKFGPTKRFFPTDENRVVLLGASTTGHN